MIDWEGIVREHRPAVWRAAHRLLGNRADADECFQETFAAAVAFVRDSRHPVRTGAHRWCDWRRHAPSTGCASASDGRRARYPAAAGSSSTPSPTVTATGLVGVQQDQGDPQMPMKVGSVSGRLFSLPDGYGYAGKGVRRGAKDKVVFWYKPDDAKTYKAVFGDLRVADVAEDKLPSTRPSPGL